MKKSNPDKNRQKMLALVARYKRDGNYPPAKFKKEMESLGYPLMEVADSVARITAFCRWITALPVVRDNPRLRAVIRADAAEAIVKMKRRAI